MDDLVRHRLSTAADKLKSATILLKEGQYNRAKELLEEIRKYLNI